MKRNLLLLPVLQSNSRRFSLIACGSLLIGFSPALSASPPQWESNYGLILADLTGEDSAATDVTLSFSFPYEGTGYMTVYVGTDGGIQLGGLGSDGEIDENTHADLNQFLDDGGFPTIFPFNADLDLDTNGSIHFLSEANRAVFTWNEVGTGKEPAHLCTFQIQLFSDGRILFGYNGLLDGPGEDLVGSLHEGILVGISESVGNDPGPLDLTSGPFLTSNDTVYEVWNHDEVPVNTLFDLEMKNVEFIPKVGGGFEVSVLENSEVNENSILAVVLQSKIKKLRKKAKTAKKQGKVAKAKKLKKKLKKLKKRLRFLS